MAESTDTDLGGTFAPTSSITVDGWMLQTPSVSRSVSRAQALDERGDEHAFATYGEQDTETAEFTLGGDYETGSMTLPKLGSTHITEFSVTYSETDFPKLSVSKSSAAVSATSWTFPLTLPVRALGVPASIDGLYTAQGAVAVKTLAIQVTAQHVEETDGSGNYGTLGEFRDVTVKATFTGVAGRPAPTMASGWTLVESQASNSNTALPSGSVAYERHYAYKNAAS